MIIVISGPGGVGKGTLVGRLLDRDPSIVLSRSWTTRHPRADESPEAYRFVDRDTFEAHAEAGGFLEWVEFLDYLQGSPVPEDIEGRDTLFEIDVNGARAILEKYPDTLFIFVDAPSPEEQRRRLEGRGDDDDHVRRRLEHGVTERRMAEELDALIIVNDDLDRAVVDLERAIAAHRTTGAGPEC